MPQDITVIIPTYNRASELSRTLEGIIRAEKGDLSIETVVVDNGSTDRTKSVVNSFLGRLRLKYLFEARPGKSSALNAALEKEDLGNIVVFTDDDVDPSREWFVSIASICERYPHHLVFGGRIKVIFPNKNVPKWAYEREILSLAFAHHHYSNDECIYEYPYTPFGPNFWVKKKVFADCRRFNEAIGAHQTNNILGEDTLFLRNLMEDGYEIVYSPKAVVSHRARPQMMKRSAIYSRAYQLGRGNVHTNGLPHSAVLKQQRLRWNMHRVGAIIWNVLKLFHAVSLAAKEKRFVKSIYLTKNIGYQIEAIRLGNSEL